MIFSSSFTASIITSLIRHSKRNFSRTVVYAHKLTSSHLNSHLSELEQNPKELLKPPPEDVDKVYSVKIQSIVSDISKLNILEVADLNALLKKALNISDAPIMATGALSGPMTSQKQDDDEEEEASATKIQTNFTVRITKFEESKKVTLIKHIKTIMEGMNLVQAKKFVETLPAVVRQDVSKEEADSLLEGLKAVGAECSIE